MADPNWYPDPHDPTVLRWWDGQGWTEHTHPIQGATVQPAAQPADAVGAPVRKKFPTWAKVLIPVVAVITVGAVIAGVSIARFVDGGALDDLVAQPDAPGIDYENATFEEVVAYYDEQRDIATDFLDANRYGYFAPFADEELAANDAAVDAEKASATPDNTTVWLAADSVTSLVETVLRPAVDAWSIEYFPKDGLAETNELGTDAEAALDQISGGVSSLTVSDECTQGDAQSDVMACVVGGGGIAGSSDVLVATKYASLNDDELEATYGSNWHEVMLHEYAHVQQNKMSPRLELDADYVRLFFEQPTPPGEDPLTWDAEASAECMAQSAMPTYRRAYPGSCTPEMLTMAQRIWDEDV